jgi:hypothetical protein
VDGDFAEAGEAAVFFFHLPDTVEAHAKHFSHPTINS